NISNALPGLPDDGLRFTLTPLATTVSVPEVVPETEATVVEVATTWNGMSPGGVPAAGVRVRGTSRKLLAPGGTSMVVWPSVAATPGGRPAADSVKVSSALPVLVT